MPDANITVVSGSVTTRACLNVRSGAPRLSAPITMKIEAGSQIAVTGTITGDAVNGNPNWYAGPNATFFWAGACGPLLAAPATTAATGGAIAGRIESAPPASFGFDLDSPLTKAAAQAFYAKGYRFCVRYLTRSQSQESANDLSRAEAEIILDAGLALMAVQHVAPQSWVPTEQLGMSYGGNAVKNAQQVGLPAGVNIWLDLEGIRPDTPRQNVLDYCNAWFSAVETAGFATGLYVGDSIVVSPDDLYWNIRTKHYWKSGSKVPDIPNRGYQMIQRIPPNADDATNVDTDFTQNDSFGDAVQWLTRRPATAIA